MSQFLWAEHWARHSPKVPRPFPFSWAQGQQAALRFTVSPHQPILMQVSISSYKTEFEAVLPTLACRYRRPMAAPSCKHPGFHAAPSSCEELFRCAGTTRTGKTSKQLQRNRHEQGAQHSPNVPPKGSTALLTSPPSAVIIHHGQDSAPKYSFLVLFSLSERLCKTLLFPHCLI